MSLHKAVVTALVAASMTSVPALAAADSASSLSVAASRSGASLENESQLGGGFLIPLLALGAVVLGILVLLDDEDDLPESP